MGRCSDARDRLLEAGARLVHERGYTAVSVADICAEARLKKGSFYHFFRSKRDLVLAVIDRYGESYASLMKACMQDVALCPRDRLRRIFAVMYESLRDSHREHGCMRGCPVGKLALEMADRDELIRAKLESIFDAWRSGLQRLLVEARAQGDLSIDDAGAAARTLVAHAQGAIVLSKASNDPALFAETMNGVLTMLEAARARVDAMQPGATRDP